MNSGLAKGPTSTESQALRNALRRIKDLENELAPVKATSEIVDAEAVVDPKGGKPSR